MVFTSIFFKIALFLRKSVKFYPGTKKNSVVVVHPALRETVVLMGFYF
jgi:hypothetical protein